MGNKKMCPVVKKLPQVAKAKRWASVFRAAKKSGYVIVLVQRIGNVERFFHKHIAGYDLLDKEGFTVSVDGVGHMFVNTHPDPGSDINRLLARYTRFKMVTPDEHTYSYVKVKSELFDKMIGGGAKSTCIQRFRIVGQELTSEKVDAEVNVGCKNGQLLKATPSASVSETLEAAPSGTVSVCQASQAVPAGGTRSSDAERMQQQAAIVLIRAQRDAVMRIINTQRANLEKSQPYVRVKASNPISCSLPVSIVQQMQSQLDREMYKCSHSATEQFIDTLLTFGQRLQREYEKYENMFTGQELASIFCSGSYAAVCDQVAGWWGPRVTMKFQEYRQGYPEQYEAPVVKAGKVTLVPARKPWTEEPHEQLGHQRKRKQTESRGTEDGAKKSKSK